MAGYLMLGFSRTLQNLWLLAASLFFYAWGEPFVVFLMIFSILMNYVLGIIVDRLREDRIKAKIAIFFTVASNLGMLFVFKYLGFVIRNINGAAGGTVISFEGFALPIGISFYTFQAMSYVLDVYRASAKVEKNPFYVGLYVAFFPQLIAGPIVRYADIAEQMRGRVLTWDGFSYGVCRFIAGLGKKVLIANSMAVAADHVFNLSAMSESLTNVPVTLAWLGAFAYTLQIYYDFSGYSDMAIGLGHMFGFTFRENFNYPYSAVSIVDFWKRWHISLSTWCREYVYFPLGGSRVRNLDRAARNLFIVWMLTGIWHGAEWTFILWGLWHSVFIVFEHVAGFGKRKMPPLPGHIYTLLVVVTGWVFFRSGDLYQAFLYLRNMLWMNDNGFFSVTALMFLREYWVFFAVGALFSLPVMPKMGDMIRSRVMGFPGRIICLAYPFAMTALFIACVSYLVKGVYNPFIYFNF